MAFSFGILLAIVLDFGSIEGWNLKFFFFCDSFFITFLLMLNYKYRVLQAAMSSAVANQTFFSLSNQTPNVSVVSVSEGGYWISSEVTTLLMAAKNRIKLSTSTNSEVLLTSFQS